MDTRIEPINDIAHYLTAQATKPLLRFITCGSVDDGKSSLIGRMLYESKQIFDDQLGALESESKRYGTQGERIDFALLVDGLQAEREQGITIDVAYRFFATDRRRFIVADTPGHEQYTRNMATGASTAALAVILIDARKGVLTQTRRHSRIVAMMGIRQIVLAVNKMDLVDYDEATFHAIVADYCAFAAPLGLTSVTAIPLSALEGDNVVTNSPNTRWYSGPALLELLETVPLDERDETAPFRLPVQWVNRPNLDFRGYCGRVASGRVTPGQRVRVLPSGVETTVRAIVTFEGEREVALAGDSITLTLADEVDVSRGDVLADAGAAPEVADQFEARLLWMAEHPLLPGRSYTAKLHCKEVEAIVTEIKYREDVNSGAQLAAKSLGLNEIAVVNLSLARTVAFDPYAKNRTLGGFILIDKLTQETVGAGMIDFALRRAANIHWQALTVNQSARATAKNQQPLCLWFTGLSGSGKSTLSNLLEKRLHAEGRHTYLLDGDNVRHGLNRDLGFTEEDRVENIRRVAEVAKLMVDAGLIVLVSFISPYRAERRLARSLFEPGEFVEVFVDTPLEECERRDTKGLYAQARRGEIKNFTGIDSDYEAPDTPEVRLLTAERSAEDCVAELAQRVLAAQWLSPEYQI
ncbi:sulfate adenylyltransferase subunit CysN [Candidatus Contendibacter odensensis]|uniref:Multifunctional fusion protein n=1 Tax=Candidatus Contendobacter odensis Run_B_J11 TaxID=1400861 RepID=A0A7U7J6B4_9GAMM|nr:sulfate adenylyltransferase subunit CysN [Candidatus Contendobacter odensis]MBK8752444.1 sulfate adenylyltransferase subunit CysN [Candidatus Competibacteraceae bacterium]CDH47701.1 Bifunctional enzyme nodQ (Includes: Sulfate adenylyltransferase subunit 1; Adenylyl-sulfate kinase) [Candidatus Contendobacter odensis Run_B_J11]